MPIPAKTGTTASQNGLPRAGPAAIRHGVAVNGKSATAAPLIGRAASGPMWMEPDRNAGWLFVNRDLLQERGFADLFADSALQRQTNGGLSIHSDVSSYRLAEARMALARSQADDGTGSLRNLDSMRLPHYCQAALHYLAAVDVPRAAEVYARIEPVLGDHSVLFGLHQNDRQALEGLRQVLESRPAASGPEMLSGAY